MEMAPAIKQIALIPEVNNQLTEIEKTIVLPEAQYLSEMDKRTAADKLAMLAGGIAKDLGINNTDEHYIARFVQMIYKYFSDYTVPEIKMAFEMLLIGRLDKFLPSYNGEPDKNHYGKLSAEYVMKVLVAYKKFRNEVKDNIAKKMPILALTDNDLMKRKIGFIVTLQKRFIDYRDEEKTYDYLYPKGVLNVLKEINIIKTIPELEPTGEKVVDIADSKRYLNNKIIEVFDYLIKHERTIYDYVKFIQR